MSVNQDVERQLQLLELALHAIEQLEDREVIGVIRAALKSGEVRVTVDNISDISVIDAD